MLSQFGLLDFGAPELIIILGIVLVLFGGKKLPELSRGLGESIREVKKASSSAGELHQEIKSQVSEVKSSINVPVQAAAQTEVATDRRMY
jgi:sec-independent protein translocase protein TatA